MAAGAKDKMIIGAVGLLARYGPQGTSFSDVLAATGAPRGSIYHYFPEGKNQLVGEALTRAADFALGRLAETSGRPAVEVTETFVGLWRQLLVASGLRAGCAVLSVTVGTDDDALLQHTGEVFRRWRSMLTELLVSGGVPAAAAGPFAILLIAATEGAVVLARAEQSLDPFEQVATQLVDQARGLTA